MKCAKSSDKGPSSIGSRLRSIGRIVLPAMTITALFIGCGDDDDDNAGTGGNAGTVGKGGAGGKGGTAATGGSGGTAGTGALAGTGGSGAAGGKGGSGGQDASIDGSAGTSTDGSAGTATDGGENDDASILESATASVETSTKLGDVVAANGKTLYFFGGDIPAGNSTADGGAFVEASDHCTENCLTPFYAKTIHVTDALLLSDFSEFTNHYGHRQITYMGWPVYTAPIDSAPGDTKADGIDKLWHAVKTPFYKIVVRRSVVVEQMEGGTTYPYTYLADGKGRSLYMFWDDTPADGGDPVPSCQNKCLIAWPPISPLDLTIVSSLSRKDFSSVNWTPLVPDGGDPDASKAIDQLVYQGWPIYYYQKDYDPGDTAGHCYKRWCLAEISGDLRCKPPSK